MDRALKMAGVVTVVTGADLLETVSALPTNWVLPGMPVPVHRVLADEVVRFQGEGIAAVVATDAYTAADAADAVDVDYEPLPAVTDPWPSTWQRGSRARLASICPWCVVISSGSSRTRRLTWCSTRAACTHSYAVIRSATRRSCCTGWRHRMCSCSNIGADATAWTGDRSDRDGDHPKTSPGSSDPELELQRFNETDVAAPLPFGPTVRGTAYRFGLRAEPISVRAVVSTRTERRCVDDARRTRAALAAWRRGWSEVAMCGLWGFPAELGFCRFGGLAVLATRRSGGLGCR